MINSRCPRPIGIIASIAMMPVCTGWLTVRRLMMPGAIFLNRIIGISLDRPLLSIGWPSVFTTRPSERLADRNLEKFAGGFDFVAFGHLWSNRREE